MARRYDSPTSQRGGAPQPPAQADHWFTDAQAAAIKQLAAAAGLNPTALAQAIADAHDTDVERETFLPARLSAQALRTVFVAPPTPTPPSNPAVGQLWYSSALKHLRAPSALAQRKVVFAQTGTWEGQAIQEPSVWIAGGYFKALFTAGSGQGFASCPLTADPTNPANWSRPATYTGPVLAGAKHASVYVEGSTLYCFYTDGATSTKVMVATASLTDAVPAFGAGTQVVTLPAGSSVFGNPYVVKDGTTYRMLIEHKVAATGRWQTGHATATTPDGTYAIDVNTMATLWPETDRQGSGGPWVERENGEWVLWYHASVNWNGLLPSDIYRATAPTLGADNWTLTDNKQPVIRRKAPHEVDQVADVQLVRAPSGTVYAFWTGMHNRGTFRGAVSCAALLPTMMRWSGVTWEPIDGPAEQGASVTAAARPRTNLVTADFTSVASDGATWEDVPGLSCTHAPSGTDVEVMVRAAYAASGSAGFRYTFRAMELAGSTTINLGSAPGTAGNMGSFIGVGKFTQLTPGSFRGFKVQVKVASGGGTISVRPVTFADREFAAITVTDTAYP